MKITFIATVLNEQDSIGGFLKSLNSQSIFPDEIIIVDGGSIDQTVANIKNSAFAKASAGKQISNKKMKVRIFVKKGNRSVGRNEAIKNAKGEIILLTDAGCILDKDWVRNIVKPFRDKAVDVVAGYYKGKSQNIFQKCLIPYVLVMKDRVDPNTFLPSTRSMAIKKEVWEKVGKFDEKLSHNEDFDFAQKLKNKGAKIVFSKNAIVNWIPRKNIKEAFFMFLRFAYGDGESGIARPKVLLVFTRYFLMLYFVFLCIIERSWKPLLALPVIFLMYILWSIRKNYKHVGKRGAFIFLPALQFTADFAVMTGTLWGIVKSFRRINYLKVLKKNKFVALVIVAYIVLELSIIDFGIPNYFRPFPFNMDEWHQMRAVFTTFAFGTPNMLGSANGTMFHFILTGLYLIPFTLLGIINPFSLDISDFVMRQNMFYALRANTIIFGVLSILTLYKISKEFIKDKFSISLILFVFSPIFLMLSNYFKYDIALIFWIILSIYFILRFSKDPSGRNFVWAAIPSAISLAVKISAAPLFFIYVFSFFLFSTKRNYRMLFTGISIFVFCFLIFGVPDTLFGKSSISLYLYENLVLIPKGNSNFNIDNPSFFLFSHQFPVIFGKGLLAAIIFSLFFWIYKIFRDIRNFNNYRVIILLIFSLFIFTLSLLSLQIFGGGNRALVLLPFIVLIVGAAIKTTYNNYKKLRPLLILGIIVLIFLQLTETLSWVVFKNSKSPQEKSSDWIIKNIEKETTIGLENVPIYQGIPDIALKEFYYIQFGRGEANKYKYQIIDYKTLDLPSVIVISDDEIHKSLFKVSDKKRLLSHIKKNEYKKVMTFKFNSKFINSNDIDYYFSWLGTTPVTISIYKK